MGGIFLQDDITKVNYFIVLIDFFLKILFIYLTEREKQRAQAGGAASRRRGRSRLPAQQGA